MKVRLLSGEELNYWVSRAEGMSHEAAMFSIPAHAYSTEWAYGGPIIERERIVVAPAGSPPDGDFEWRAQYPKHPRDDWNFYGDTPLIAAMRAFVADKFGLDVEEQAA